MSAAEHDHDAKVEQELKRLKSRFEALREDQVRTEEKLKSLTAQLDGLKATAKTEYGTDDPAELARILDERRAANDRLVEEYRRHVEAIEADLAKIEAQAGNGDGQ